MTDNAVVVNKLSKSYGPLLALDDISLTIPQGAFFGLLGPNGAGKTTLIGILGGLIFAYHDMMRKMLKKYMKNPVTMMRMLRQMFS